MTRALTVLIVDDSASMRAILHAIIGADGHHAILADSVSAALEVLDVQHPDVILTDFNMPGETGLDLVRRVRTRTALDNTPVFVVSSEQAPDRRSRMAHAGANGWIGKPVCPATLLMALDAVALGSRISAPRDVGAEMTESRALQA
jgi:two-component system, chemotaxis family, chemotaxis protein CheY